MAAQDEMGRRDGEHVEALDRLVKVSASASHKLESLPASKSSPEAPPSPANWAVSSRRSTALPRSRFVWVCRLIARSWLLWIVTWHSLTLFKASTIPMKAG